MRSVAIRTRAALVLLALMAFMVLPRTWFHTCAHAWDTEHVAGHATIAADGHCPICDQVQPHYVQPVAVAAPVFRTTASILDVLLPAAIVSGQVDAGSTRGPPLS